MTIKNLIQPLTQGYSLGQFYIYTHKRAVNISYLSPKLCSLKQLIGGYLSKYMMCYPYKLHLNLSKLRLVPLMFQSATSSTILL